MNLGVCTNRIGCTWPNFKSPLRLEARERDKKGETYGQWDEEEEQVRGEKWEWRSVSAPR